MIPRRHLLAIAGGLLVVAGCDPSAEFGPPDAMTRSTIQSAPTVGTTLAEVTVTVRDAEGRAVTGRTVSWVADMGGSASPAESATDDEGRATTSWTIGTTAGDQTLTASIGDLQTTFTVSAIPGPLATLAIDHGGRVLHAIQDTLRLAVVAEDQYGNSLADAGIAWSSLDPVVATVAGGVVTAAGEGTARIVAALASRADTALVDVDQVIAGISFYPVRPRVLALLPAADTLHLEAVAADSNGFSMDSAVTATWATSAPGVVSVTASGVIEAVATGTARITATAGEFTGEAEFKVKEGPRPQISGISPAVITSGDTITITGTDFSGTPSLNTVTVAGVPAEVVTAGPTQLTAALALGSLPCAPTSSEEVVVTVDELEGWTDHPLSAATQQALAVGESVTLTGSGVACNELPNAGAYVVSVFNASAATAYTDYRLRGTGSGSLAVAADASVAAAMATLPRRSITITPRRLDPRSRPEDEAHARILDMNLELLERLGRPPSGSGTGGLLSATATAVPTVGDILPLRIPDIDANPCSLYKAVNARVVYVGDYGVILEDTLAPAAGQMDATWEAVGQEYDQDMHQVLLDYFGDPLVLDAELDQNGRILMLFSKAVNDFERGVAGFVFSGDFFPRDNETGCQSSDVAEIFYGMVPESATGGFNNGDGILSPDEWKRTMRSTVIHEVKHVLSYANRLDQAGDGNASFEARWLEESTARLAEEFYARTYYGYGQDWNTDYQSSIFCEVRPQGFEQDCGSGSPYVMAKHYLNGLLEYYRFIESLSPVGGDTDDFTFYGSGWLLVRWAIDHTATTEAAFIKALVGEPTLTGVTNLAARTGRSFPEMLADFSLAIAVDDRDGFTPARPELSFPSWNTRDVFLGLHNDFGDRVAGLEEPFPLSPRTVSFGDFDVSVRQLRGGTASLFDLTGTLSGSQLLELLSAAGGVAPSNLGLAIVRVQ